MILQDIRFALRMMRLRIGYTAIVIVTLALSIGATTAMFSTIHAVLLRPLPFRDPSRLVRIWENDRLNHKPRYSVAPANYDDWRNQTRTFEQIAAYLGQGGTISGGGEPFHANVGVVTPNFFETLGVAPMLGRQLTTADGVPPNNRVLVLSHAVWQLHFGADPGVIDRTVQYGDTPHRIIAVMPEGFAFPDRSGRCLAAARDAAGTVGGSGAAFLRRHRANPADCHPRAGEGRSRKRRDRGAEEISPDQRSAGHDDGAPAGRHRRGGAPAAVLPWRPPSDCSCSSLARMSRT